MSESNEQKPPIAEPDYEVGYGKPPKATQFKPGQSGNPKGRKRKPKSVQAQMRKEVVRKVSITERGVSKRMSIQDLIFRAITNKAAKGDLRAARLVFSLLHDPAYAETDVIDQADLSPEDQAMLDQMMSSFAQPDAPDLPSAQCGEENMSAAVDRFQDQDGMSPPHDDQDSPKNVTGDEDDVDDR